VRSPLPLLFLLGCAGGKHEAHDAGGPALDCVDDDGDGYGEGADCAGPDCNDSNPDVWIVADCQMGCAVGAHDFGCECDAAEFPDPEPCYTGPAGTEDVGECAGGQRSCTDGTWSACEGQVTPTTESCDYVDDNCDGEVDEAVSSACGCGLSVGVGCTDPFTAEATDSVVLDAEGALVLDAADTDGVWTRHYEEVCTGEVPDPAWTTLDWNVDAPAGTSVSFESRREDCGGDPGTNAWVPVAAVPSDTPPIDMRDGFEAAGEPLPFTCLGLRVRLHADVAGTTPRVLWVSPNLTCT
jgi:hypothetical protein